MTILHLLSQNHLTGAEVYACQLAELQISAGHQVFQVSNGFYFPTKAQKITLDVETTSKIQFFKSVLKLRALVREHKIQIIHAHSRAASKLAYYSLLGLNKGLVSTIHGRQHFSISKRLHNIYGDYQIAICENVASQLKDEFHYAPEKIKLIRNGINADLFYPKKINSIKTKAETLKIALIGRATGPKKNRTENFIQHFGEILKKQQINFECHLIGANENDIRADLCDKNVYFHPYQNLHQGIYSQFDLIVGSGRVCMEALMCGVAAIAFGEAQYLGLCAKDNLSEFMKSNFGDINSKSMGSPDFNSSQALLDLENFYKLNVAQLLDLAKLAKNHFAIKPVAEQIQRIYEASNFQKHYSAWIPVLMYHKIPDQELSSPHKIYVTKSDFEKHLQFYKNQGFQTLTFSDLKKYKQGLLPMAGFPKKPLILTFDDGYWDNLKNASVLLKQYEFKAQIFLLADADISFNKWDETDAARADQIVAGADRKLWLESAFEIGSHGFNHQRITAMSEEDAYKELLESKKSLEKEFDQPVCVFAYTYGDTNQISAQLAEKAGYDFAVNTDTGGLKIFDDPYQIFRVNIFPNETTLSLWKKTSRWYRRYYFWKRKK